MLILINKNVQFMRHTLLIVLLAITVIYGKRANAQACPNGDFENWTTHSYDQPDTGWFTSNPQSLGMHDTLTVWKVPGYSGQAIHIQTAIIGTDTMQAYIVNTPGDPSSGMGGVPYSQQPTAIAGYYRYNLPGNDSAALWVIFKK